MTQEELNEIEKKTIDQFKDGHKEVLGMYVSENEGANFWLQVLTDLQNRGLENIMMACTDDLKGFIYVILSIYPKAEVQLCIVHQIRNSLKYVASRDQKEFLRDLKRVYRATNKDVAEDELLKLEEKWGKKYPVVIESWNHNWEELLQYFKYTELIRKLIYTTNPVEGYNRQIRKVTKTNGVFPNDMTLLKLVYLATKNIEKKWISPLQNWSLTIQQLYIRFESRAKLDSAVKSEELKIWTEFKLHIQFVHLALPQGRPLHTPNPPLGVDL